MSYFYPREPVEILSQNAKDGLGDDCNAQLITQYRTEIEQLQEKVASLSSALVCRNQQVAQRLRSFVAKNAQKVTSLEVRQGKKRIRSPHPKREEGSQSRTETKHVLSTDKLLRFIEYDLLESHKARPGLRQSLSDTLQTVFRLESAQHEKSTRQAKPVRPNLRNPYESTDFYVKAGYTHRKADKQEHDDYDAHDSASEIEAAAEEPVSLTPLTEMQFSALRLSPGCRQFAMPCKRPRELPLEAE